MTLPTKHRIVLFALLMTIACASKGDSPLLKEKSDDAQFRSGQIWQVADMPGATATVLRVDEASTVGTIVHLRIDGISLENPRAPSGRSTELQHAPFARAVVVSSVVGEPKLISNLPAYEDGYATWRSAFENGKAGAFSIPISQAVAAMQTTLKQ